MKLLQKVVALLTMLIFLPAFGSGERGFAPTAERWELWETHDQESGAAIDHGKWNAFLQRYVSKASSGVNLVGYGAVSTADKSALKDYIAAMSAVKISGYNRAEQMAYWINVYNAVTIGLILDNKSVDSIRDISSGGLFSSGPWDKELFSAEGQSLTLNDIEHRILRPIWKDPRIHYAVNCASIGCPNLKPTAYTAASLEKDLDAAARAYVNDPRGVTVSNGLVIVSKIYDWFIDDFGGNEAGVLKHLKKYADAELASKLDAAGGLDQVQYDWSLNVVN